MNKIFIDQLGNSVKVSFPPKKIISLVPSQTELLCDLGLDKELIGITRYCIHPKSIFESKVKVGGTKNYKLDKIRALKPDLIIANKEENDKESLELLAKEFPIWISDIKNLDDALEMIMIIGKICSKEIEAIAIAHKIELNFSHLKAIGENKKVLYLIWKDPYMSVNKNTFIHDILVRAGYKNVCADFTNRYPEINLNDLQKQSPDYIFLSSEPYPFQTKHIALFEEKFPNAGIKIVNGELFSWYGSRLLKTTEYLEKL